MATLEVQLVAADRMVYEGEAKLVRARTLGGELGIMPGHQPLLGVLVEGEVRINSDAGVQIAVIDGGFLSVDQDRVTIVAEDVDASGMSV
ncbi:MAG TPA: F0F1 ATP synthase subunit epsilon [Intrasporangiaceae bacterium]|nr:F0F1 ATP synthase subunit epsilon [Intrasporangiaceae bacterium]